MGIDESLSVIRFRQEMLRCQIWGFIPVFGFIAFFCMADNSGEAKYRSLGKKFCIFNLTALGIAVSGDLIIYLVTITLGGGAPAYARSVIYIAWLMLPVSYLTELIRMLTLRREYLEICMIKRQSGTECVTEIKDAAPAMAERIDINNCSKEELAGLPGIDAASAVRILKDREETGGFASVEEFIDRYGIKPHFAAELMERAYAGDRSFPLRAGRPVRAIDI